MVPIVVVILVAASQRGEAGVRRLLAPVLAGFGGVLLLLPVGLPASVGGRLILGGLVLVAILVAVSGIWLYRLLQGVRLAEAIGVVGLSNAVFLLICSLVDASLVWRWGDLVSIFSVGSLIDLVEVALIVWLLGEMVPVRFAARYLVIPLLTVAEGYVLLRPSLTARMGFGDSVGGRRRSG